MKLLTIDGEVRVYLTMQEMVECGFEEARLREAKSRGVKCWDIIDHPEDKRKVLVGFEALNDWRKKMVTDRYGDPYDYVARTPILTMVVNDWKASDWYRDYTYKIYGGVDKWLPKHVQYQYTRAASWLGMLKAIDKGMMRKDLGLTVEQFYKHVDHLIQIEKGRAKLQGYAGVDVLPGDFPGTYQRLLAKVARFTAEGYESIVAPEYGNKYASKLGRSAPSFAEATAGESGRSAGLTMTAIAPEMGCLVPNNDVKSRDNDLILVENDQKCVSKGGAFDPELHDKQMSVIRRCSEMHNNFDAGQVAEFANLVFTLNGWKTLTVARVRQIMKENEHLTTAGSKGTKTHRNKIAMQVKRKVTPMPMLYWTLDGWTAELAYREQRKATKTRSAGWDYKRLVVVVVLDVYKKYPIGYAIGDRETSDLIREANRNALEHAWQLFGGHYRPAQVQSDNYQIKNLTPFYQAMTHLHTPAAVGNAKAKVIEPYFMYLNKEYCQKMPNWTGFNVTSSKDNQVNAEFTDKIKHTFPDRAGVMQQIVTIMERERALKQAEYVAAWPKVTEEHRYSMNDMQYLEVMGRPLGKTNRLAGEGVVKVIGGEQFVFDSFDEAFRAHRHVEWQLIGDERDLTKVLAVSPDGGLKFVLEQKRIVPMDIASTTAEDHAYRARITQFNKDQERGITELYGRDADMVRAIVDSTPFELGNVEEMALKLMLTERGQQKEGIQDAKGLNGSAGLTMTKKAPSFAEATAGESGGSAGLTMTKKEAKREQEEWLELQEARMDERVDFSVFKSL
jgi:hypothetical protein